MARGGGDDGGATVAEMNRPVELCRRRAAMAELRWCCRELVVVLGEAERAGGSESGRVNGVAGVRCLSARSGLIGWVNASVLQPRGGHGLWLISHDTARGH